jgi:hypothetical protein
MMSHFLIAPSSLTKRLPQQCAGGGGKKSILIRAFLGSLFCGSAPDKEPEASCQVVAM